MNLMCHKTLLTVINQGEYLLMLLDMSLTHVGLQWTLTLAEVPLFVPKIWGEQTNPV